jgi:hypothetical protein
MIRILTSLLASWCSRADRRRDSGKRARRQMEIERELLERHRADRVALQLPPFAG